MNSPALPRRDSLSRRPLEYVAFWQALGFLLLICVTWTAQVLDLSAIVFDASHPEDSWFYAWILTAAIIVIGFITVAHTYLQERRILRGLIRVCSYCHKVQIDPQAWQQMEIFVADRTLAEFTHGVCPTCYQKVSHQIDDPGAATSPD